MEHLKGKVALITGVSRRQGIGFGIAKRLAAGGADLFLHSYAPYDEMMEVNLEKNEAVLIRKELSKYSVTVKQQEADFMEAESPGIVIQDAIQALGKIDILIINHTHDTLKTLEQLDAREIDRHLSVNVRASLLLIQKFVKHYHGNPGGRIILLTSGQHLGPMPHLAYVASKGALHDLTWSLADSLAEKNITVNTVNPGPTRTYVPDPEIDREVLRRMPFGRWGTPDDAARLIDWLVSEEAAWITGQVIDSEGGFRRG
ncbi:MAG: SDR family oxidoreductase [bacterium]|nr:MAG: SDR family oxidoreductase [bacterium]